MYVYLYDSSVKQAAFAQILKEVEIQLTDLGLSGKVIRLGNYNDARSVIEYELKITNAHIII